MWAAQFSEAPPTFLDYLRWICVADGDKSHGELRFHPSFTTREAVVDFAGAQSLRDARLLRPAANP
jgi:UDP-glucose 4-epimerase